MAKQRPGPVGSLLGALVACLAATAGLAYAAGDEASTIQACRTKARGHLRVVSDTTDCRKNELPLSWSVAGRQGNPGPAGPPGPKGDPGPPLASIGDLNGLSCTTHDGAAGEIAVQVSDTDTITLRCVGQTLPPPPVGAAKLVVNEVDYDQVGADGNGFVELYNAGDAAADLTGIALVYVNGGDSREYGRKALTGTLAAGAYLVVEVELQNGAPDGVALLDTARQALVDVLSYEGAMNEALIGGQTYNLVEGTMLPETVADSNTVDGSLIRNPNGKDTNDAAADWAFTTTVTKGAANVHTN